jgi:hypothetical protein
MEWKILFDILIEENLLEDAINKVESKSDFKYNSNRKLEFRKLENGKTEGITYDFKSETMYAVEFEDKIVSVGDRFLLDSLRSKKLHEKLKKELNYNFTFFDFQFELYLIFAADISSGQTWFKNSVGEILESLKYGKANLNGKELSNESDLINYLRNNLYGLSKKTDYEIKMYYQK